MSVPHAIPDPSLVVLIGASGSGKSTWARQRYRTIQIVSSDELRSVVGSGPSDLDASVDAFAVLDAILAARVRRGLTTVVDTVGLDAGRRRGYLELARSAKVPAVAVVFRTDAATCRVRNAGRDRPVPAPVLAMQLRKMRSAAEDLAVEGWDMVIEGDAQPAESPLVEPPKPVETSNPRRSGELFFVLQISRFPWGTDPAGWLRTIAAAAKETGFGGLALMDHLIQIPQVGRAWDPIPEPFVTLGFLAGVAGDLNLGTLVSPITFRSPGIVAKSLATLDVLTGGRAFCGIGAGWWEREHLAFGVPFPPARERLDRLEPAIETMRALWAPGTKSFRGGAVDLPETTCYPRPAARIPIIVGGGGERRTLRIAARFGDGCNVPSDLAVLDRKIAVLHEHCRELGRDPGEVRITVLDVPVIGSDRDQIAATVERLRGRTAASVFARRHHAGPVAEQITRYRTLADRGVHTVFLALPDLAGPDEVLRCAPVLAAFR